MDDSAAASRQLADQRQCDDALASAGTARYRDHSLGITGARVFNGMHN